jgi:hypothetical protein
MNAVLNRRSLCLLAVALACALTMGCAHRPAPLYDWGSYQAQVYEHFKGQGKGPQEQLAAMEEDLQKIRSTDGHVPPGFHAHMGLLYLALGKDDQAVQSWRTEQTLFPESKAYIDFLLSKNKVTTVK